MKRSSPQLQKEGGGSELTHHCSSPASTCRHGGRKGGVQIHFALWNKIHFAIWEKYILQSSSPLQKEGCVSELTHHQHQLADIGEEREGGVLLKDSSWFLIQILNLISILIFNCKYPSILFKRSSWFFAQILSRLLFLKLYRNALKRCSAQEC